MPYVWVFMQLNKPKQIVLKILKNTIQ